MPAAPKDEVKQGREENSDGHQVPVDWEEAATCRLRSQWRVPAVVRRRPPSCGCGTAPYSTCAGCQETCPRTCPRSGRRRRPACTPPTSQYGGFSTPPERRLLPQLCREPPKVDSACSEMHFIQHHAVLRWHGTVRQAETRLGRHWEGFLCRISHPNFREWMLHDVR